MTNFNNLTDDCILHILDRLKLQNQIPLRIVCRRWSEVIESKCHTIQSLRVLTYMSDFSSRGFTYPTSRLKPKNGIIIGQKFVKNFFVCKHPSEGSFIPLTLFPNVVHLELNHVDRNADLVAYFLEAWRDNLISLVIKNSHLTKFEPEICCQIRGMTNLRHLELREFGENPYPNIVVHEKSVLPQLENLTLDGYRHDFRKISAKLGPNLRELFVRGPWVEKVCTPEELNQFGQLVADHSQLGLTKLGINFAFESVQEEMRLLKLICDHFGLLTELELLLSNCKILISEMTAQLSRLPSLTKFKTELGLHHHKFDHNPNHLKLAPLESIRHLNIRITDHFPVFISPWHNNNNNSGYNAKEKATLTTLIHLIPRAFPSLTKLTMFITPHSEDQVKTIVADAFASGEPEARCKVDIHENQYML